MAFYYDEPSRTFNEYLLVPGHTPSTCVPTAVSLKTPLVKYRKGEEECPLSLSIPMVSAIMAGRLRRQHGGRAGDRRAAFPSSTATQTIEDEAAMVARVKDYKAGFVVSDCQPASRHDAGARSLALKERNGHSTMRRHRGRQPRNGKLLGIVTEPRLPRVSRMALDEKVADVHDAASRSSSSPPRTPP